VSTTEEVLDRKVAAPVYKTENTAVGNRHADHVAPSIRKRLAITSPTNGGLSVGIVRSRTQFSLDAHRDTTPSIQLFYCPYRKLLSWIGSFGTRNVNEWGKRGFWCKDKWVGKIKYEKSRPSDIWASTNPRLVFRNWTLASMVKSHWVQPVLWHGISKSSVDVWACLWTLLSSPHPYVCGRWWRRTAVITV
jgi:hypothetical protein